MAHNPDNAACPRTTGKHTKNCDYFRHSMSGSVVTLEWCTCCTCPARPPASIAGIEIVPDESVPDGELRFVQSADSEVEKIRERLLKDGILDALELRRITITLLRIIDRQAGELNNLRLCRKELADITQAIQNSGVNLVTTAKRAIEQLYADLAAAHKEIERLTAENAAYSKHLHMRASK